MESLAWPAAIVVLVMLLRRQIADLLSGPMRTFKFGLGGAEIEWERAATEVVASSVRSLPSSSEVDGADLDAELDELERLVDTVPSVALQRAFAVVERELRRVTDEANIEPPPDDAGTPTLIKIAELGGAITKNTKEALRGLVVLRDLAAGDVSGTRITPEKAREFIALSRGVLYAIRLAR